MPVRIVHLSQEAGCSGAGRAALRIHLALRRCGAESRLITVSGCGQARGLEGVEWAWRSPYERMRMRAVSWTEARLGRAFSAGGHGIFSLGLGGGYRASADPRILDADVVILYWVAGGFLSPEEIARIGAGRPLIWRLSDAWPFTGGCHYPGACERFRDGCAGCPQLRLRWRGGPSAWVWRRKARSYDGLVMTVVAPSRWIADLAGASALLGGFRVEVIPTGVDTRSFAPVDRATREALRRRLGVGPDAFVVCFVAGDLDDPRKGLRSLLAGLEGFLRETHRPKVEVVLIGRGGGEAVSGLAALPCRVIRAGWQGSERALAAYYAVSDLLVVPSVEDNLPNVMLEAMACGLPVAAAATGGSREVIRDDINGFLMASAAPGEVARALGRAYASRGRLDLLGREARNLIEREYDSGALAARWLELCDEMAGGHGRKDAALRAPEAG